MARMVTRLAVGLSVALLDLALMFVSWVFHPGAVAVPDAAMPGADLLFKLATFPILSILPASNANWAFWAVIICNPLLWGAMAFWLCGGTYARATNRKRPT